MRKNEKKRKGTLHSYPQLRGLRYSPNTVCKHHNNPTHMSHFRTRDFSRVAQDNILCLTKYDLLRTLSTSTSNPAPSLFFSRGKTNNKEDSSKEKDCVIVQISVSM